MLNGAAPVMIGGPDAHPEGLAILQGIFSDSPGICPEVFHARRAD